MKIKIVFLIAIILFNVTGCQQIIANRREISDITFTRAVGIDKGITNPENVMITMGIKHSKPGNIGVEKDVEILSNEERTLFDAVRNTHTFSNQKVFWGQNEFVIIGEEAAKDDLYKYLDFFVRDHELRLNALVYIVKDGRANDVLRKTNTPRYFLGERLKSLSENAGATSISSIVSVLDVAKMIYSEHSSLYIPYIRLTNKIQEKSMEGEDALDIQMIGYAIFKDNKLVGYISGEDARGVNWVLNNIESGIIVVEGEKDIRVSLEIMTSKAKIIPKFNNDKLKITIKVNMTSNIGEITDYVNPYNKKEIDYLQSKQEQVIKKEISNSIKILQDFNADILGIGDTVTHKFPIKWQNIKQKWDEIFPKLEFDIIVTSKINRTYKIVRPINKGIGE